MATTPADVAVELGRLAPDSGSTEFLQWVRWIKRARSIINRRLGDLSILDQDVLDDVIVQAVANLVKRPDQATQVDTQIDDARVSKRYDTSAGRLVILDEWWELLSPGLTSSNAFTILAYGEPDLLFTPGTWC